MDRFLILAPLVCSVACEWGLVEPAFKASSTRNVLR